MTQGRFLSQQWARQMLVLLLAPILLAACAVGGVAVGSPVYSSLPITARVVDADTGQPLEGVVIVARWAVERTAVQSKTTEQLMVAEAVTNAEGEFRIPAWGSKPASMIDRVTATAPELVLFKSGYEGQRVANKIDGSISAAPIIHSDWNGRTITLKKFTGNDKEWAKKVNSTDSSIDFAFDYRDCSWKQIPRMLVEMHQERLRLDAKGVKDPFSYIHTLEDREKGQNKETRDKCGSIKEYIRSYLP